MKKPSEYFAVARVVFTRWWVLAFSCYTILGAYDLWGSQIAGRELPRLRDAFPLMPANWWAIGLLLLLFVATFQHAVSLATQNASAANGVHVVADGIATYLSQGHKLKSTAGINQDAERWLIDYRRWTSDTRQFLERHAPRALAVFDNTSHWSAFYQGVHNDLQNAYGVLNKRCSNLEEILKHPAAYFSPARPTAKST